MCIVNIYIYIFFSNMKIFWVAGGVFFFVGGPGR